MLTRDQIVDAISGLTVLELVDLLKLLEERFGVTASVPITFVPEPTGPPAVEEQTEFDVILTNFGTNKIQIIKAVREITGLGLKEAKEFVEAAPRPVKENLSRLEADQIKAKLEAEGAGVEVR